MTRPPINSSGWHGFDRDDADPRLIWPNAALFTADECARLIALRHRVQRGLVGERTPDTNRLLFYRWAVRVKGLFCG